MDNPKISVLIPMYNRKHYIAECVDSILKNTAYPNYELIMVDNHSTDDTAAYLLGKKKEDKRIRLVLNKTNRGFAGGGTRRCRGACAGVRAGKTGNPGKGRRN